MATIYEIIKVEMNPEAQKILEYYERNFAANDNKYKGKIK